MHYRARLSHRRRLLARHTTLRESTRYGDGAEGAERKGVVPQRHRIDAHARL